jgi:phosphoglycerate dehydrogenase-like enzyme
LAALSGRTLRAQVKHVERVFSRTQLHALLAVSDFVVGSAPATAETYQMIGEAELRRMKPTAYLINVGRVSWSMSRFWSAR